MVHEQRHRIPELLERREAKVPASGMLVLSGSMVRTIPAAEPSPDPPRADEHADDH
ncbi:hypothetical protein [Streptomyces sp. NPDC019208]|uniref:hypothetical protein n=1 Tax=unclassified Streptomyces TaxID=2593676 RepID=UPI0033E41D8F